MLPFFSYYYRSSDTCGNCYDCASLLCQETSLIDKYDSIISFQSEYHLSGQNTGKSPGEIEVNVEMQRCGAYEVVQLSQQRVAMKDNPAYVDVKLRTSA